jgi:hypothetical protein
MSPEIEAAVAPIAPRRPKKLDLMEIIATYWSSSGRVKSIYCIPFQRPPSVRSRNGRISQLWHALSRSAQDFAKTFPDLRVQRDRPLKSVGSDRPSLRRFAADFACALVDKVLCVPFYSVRKPAIGRQTKRFGKPVGVWRPIFGFSRSHKKWFD